jgi:hypothetical protein
VQGGGHMEGCREEGTLCREERAHREHTKGTESRAHRGDTL